MVKWWINWFQIVVTHALALMKTVLPSVVTWESSRGEKVRGQGREGGS